MQASVESEKEINPRALKHKFAGDLLNRISNSIARIYPAFDRRAFSRLVSDLEPLEMKPRVWVIRDELRRQLPDDYPHALKILLKSASDGSLEGFDLWPYTEYVQTFGLLEPGVSLDALCELTKVFTSEWAVRPFITRYQEKSLKYLEQCTRADDLNVRRWASEGSRPRLPWGERLQEFVKDPRPTLPILERLKHDPELFVRRSVANHLNDIAKDHPQYVVDTLNRWQSEAKGDDAAKIEWIIKRSLRTLIKAGHPEALNLVGVLAPKITIEEFEIGQKAIRIGEQLDFRVAIRSTSNRDQKLVVDYLIHFLKANGTTTSKVFKLKNVLLPANGSFTIEKHHSVKQTTTRKYYAGLHGIEIQINGVVTERRDWHLEL